MLPSIFNDNLFDDFFNFPFYDDKTERRAEKKLYGHHAHNLMKTDIKEKKDGYELEMDLPGFKKDDIQAELENGYLTIKAEKKLDKEEGKKDDKKEKNYIRKERYSGSMSRSFYVGDEVTQDEIQAKYEDGILRLNIPKKEKAAVEQKKYVAIEG